VTGDETWVHHYQKSSGGACNGSISHLLLKEIQDTTISRQVDVEDLLGFSRTYSSDLPGMWRAIISAAYCDIIQRRLKPALHFKRKGRLWEGILLLHDNACPDTGGKSAHSPDLAPSDLTF
jgi:hypothetical protein